MEHETPLANDRECTASEKATPSIPETEDCGEIRTDLEDPNQTSRNLFEMYGTNEPYTEPNVNWSSSKNETFFEYVFQSQSF